MSKTLAIVLGTAGGVGTTFVGEMLIALATLSQLSTAVVDADPGFQGYRARNGDLSAAALPWLPVGHNDAIIFNGARWHSATLDHAQFQLIDAGANLVRSSSAILEMLGDAIAAALARKTRVVVFIVTDTSRQDSAAAVEDLRRKLAPIIDIVVVQNDRGDRLRLVVRPSPRLPDEVQVPYWPPGLMAVRLAKRLPIASILARPLPGYRCALGYIANQLLFVLEQAPMAAMFTARAGESLAYLSEGSPDPELFDNGILAAVRDDVIEVKAAAMTETETLISVDATILPTLTAAAVELRKQHDIYDKMLTARLLDG